MAKRRRRPRTTVVEEVAPLLGEESLAELRDNPHLSDENRAAAEKALDAIPDAEIDAEVQEAIEAERDEIDAAAAEFAAAEVDVDDEGFEVASSVFNGDPGWEVRRGPVVAVAPTQEGAKTTVERIERAKAEGITEETAEAFDDWSAEPPFDPEIFECGPLAAGIRMCEALLTEARAGYISAQIEELERVLEESFADPERFFLGNVAAQERTATGLPDVAGAYKALVRAKSAVA